MGWRNTYRKGMPATEIFLKDIAHSFRGITNFFKNGFRTRNLYIYPDYPSKKTSIYKVANQLNLNLSNKRKGSAELYVYWEDTTFSENQIDLNKDSENPRILNTECIDISKEKVDEVLQSVFGYSTSVDPLTFKGRAVQKSDINALHDGVVIELPITNPQKDKIYQILIDNSTSESEVVDLRIPIVKEALDFVYLKHKNADVRFDNVTTHVGLKSAEEIFSPEELQLINTFSQKMGLEYGELDILRDNNSGKIYIIDVNKTPYGPPAGLEKELSKKAVVAIAAAFKKEFL